MDTIVKSHKLYLKALQEKANELLLSKKKCQEFLINAGIHDINGNLSKHYK